MERFYNFIHVTSAANRLDSGKFQDKRKGRVVVADVIKTINNYNRQYMVKIHQGSGPRENQFTFVPDEFSEAALLDMMRCWTMMNQAFVLNVIFAQVHYENRNRIVEARKGFMLLSSSTVIEFPLTAELKGSLVESREAYQEVQQILSDSQ